MSSGQKKLVENTNERALSADVNRMQEFIARDRAQTLRRLHNNPSVGFSDYKHPGLYPDMAALPADPSYGTVHDVFGGLMVRCDLANDLLVDPGSIGMYTPSYAGLTAEDSPYIVVDDPGVQSTGVLTFTPNAGAGPRIDMIECRAVPVTVETTTRDIYDSTTQAFVPTSVPKVTKAQLEYRIRLGTVNAGFPAPAQEWCPLAYCVVQVGATGFTQADFYDVRPLVPERTAMFGKSNVAPSDGQHGFTTAGVFERQIQPALNECYGYFNGAFNNYRIGGMLYRNTASSLAEFGGAGSSLAVSASNAGNQCTGACAPAVTNGTLNSMMAVFPWNLGRCVRYSQAAETATYTGQVTLSGSRVPKGANGILVVGRATSISASGAVLVTGLPAVFGSAAQDVMGVIVGWFLANGTDYIPAQSMGKKHLLVLGSYPQTLAAPTLPSSDFTLDVPLTISGSGSGLNLGTFPGRLPVTAARVLLHVGVFTTLDGSLGSWWQSSMWMPQSGVGGSFNSYEVQTEQYYPNQAAVQINHTNWLSLTPRTDPGSAGGPGTTYKVRFLRIAGADQVTAVTVEQASILGWEDN